MEYFDIKMDGVKTVVVHIYDRPRLKINSGFNATVNNET